MHTVLMARDLSTRWGKGEAGGACDSGCMSEHVAGLRLPGPQGVRFQTCSLRAGRRLGWRFR